MKKKNYIKPETNSVAIQAQTFPDFVIAYPKKYKSYNFSRQECKKQGFSRIGGRACYFTRLFARLPKQQKQPLIIKHLQTYFEKVTKSGKRKIISSRKQIAWLSKHRRFLQHLSQNLSSSKQLNYITKRI